MLCRALKSVNDASTLTLKTANVESAALLTAVCNCGCVTSDLGDSDVAVYLFSFGRGEKTRFLRFSKNDLISYL